MATLQPDLFLLVVLDLQLFQWLLQQNSTNPAVVIPIYVRFIFNLKLTVGAQSYIYMNRPFPVPAPVQLIWQEVNLTSEQYQTLMISAVECLPQSAHISAFFLNPLLSVGEAMVNYNVCTLTLVLFLSTYTIMIRKTRIEWTFDLHPLVQ